MAATIKLRFRADVTNNIPADHEIQLNLAMRDAVADATRFGAALTAVNTPRRTGLTASSVQASVSGGGSSVTGSFGSDSPVFEYLERGTRPHIIRPRFKRALFWPGARHPVGKVRHPGTMGQHTLEHSAEAAGMFAKEKLRGVFGEVFG